jgi:hypothetical protein
MVGKLSFNYVDISVPNASIVQETQINRLGDAIGFVITDNPDGSQTNTAILYKSGTLQTVAAPNSIITQLVDINDSGVIAGTSFDANNAPHAFIDSNGRFTNIDPRGATTAAPIAINNNNQIIGQYTDVNFDVGSFIYSGGKTTVLSAPGASQIEAWAINNNGFVVGQYQGKDGLTHGFATKNGHNFSINGPGAYFTIASGVSDSNDVFGIYISNAPDGSQQIHGYPASPTKFSTIDAPDGSPVSLSGINTANQVIGHYDNSSGEHGFVYYKGKETPINIGGATNVTPIAINNFGVVAGVYTDADFALHSFLWYGGQSVPVNFPDSNGTIINSLNNKGQTAGYYVPAGAKVQHGYIATPTGDTSSISFIQPNDPDTSLSDTVAPATGNIGNLVASAAADRKVAHTVDLLPKIPATTASAYHGLLTDTGFGSLIPTAIAADLHGIPALIQS